MPARKNLIWIKIEAHSRNRKTRRILDDQAAPQYQGEMKTPHKKVSQKETRVNKKTSEIQYLKKVGTVRSCFGDRFGVPRQSGLVPSSRGEIIFAKQYHPHQSLQGLNEFSHLWVIWGFHQKQQLRFHAKVHPPLMGGESVGVFASRSPHRPSALGLSLVEIIEVKSDRITIGNHDLLDGTPVFDVKPYLPMYEAIPHAKMGWRNRHLHQPMEVRFSPSLIWGDDFTKKANANQLKELIVQTLAQDPRPLIYRGENSKEKNYRTEHVVRIYDWDVFFQVMKDANGSETVEVTQVVFVGQGKKKAAR